ncbi:MAG: hypothetical protein ACLSFO_00975 [Anaerovoracaceae bacterium]
MRDKIRKHSKTIGIMGACRRSGATYVATSLALAMAKKTERTAYLETTFGGSLQPRLWQIRWARNDFPGRFSDFFLEIHREYFKQGKSFPRRQLGGQES